MCGLCGDLTPESHWSEQGPAATSRRHQHERVQAIRKLLAGTGLSVSEWRGRGYQLSNGRGRTTLVGDLGALWEEAHRMRGAPIDPLVNRPTSS